MVVSGWRIGWLSRNSTLRGSGQQAVRCRARLGPNPAADPPSKSVTHGRPEQASALDGYRPHPYTGNN